MSVHVEFHPPELPGTGQRVCGGGSVGEWWVLRPILVFSLGQAEQKLKITQLIWSLGLALKIHILSVGLVSEFIKTLWSADKKKNVYTITIWFANGHFILYMLEWTFVYCLQYFKTGINRTCNLPCIFADLKIGRSLTGGSCINIFKQ